MFVADNVTSPSSRKCNDQIDGHILNVDVSCFCTVIADGIMISVIFISSLFLFYSGNIYILTELSDPRNKQRTIDLVFHTGIHE